jgi:hypothetical protein
MQLSAVSCVNGLEMQRGQSRLNINIPFLLLQNTEEQRRGEKGGGERELGGVEKKKERKTDWGERGAECQMGTETGAKEVRGI